MGNGVSRIGADTAGGPIIGPPKSSNVYVNGSLVALDGAKVAPHGDTPHQSASVPATSATVYVNGQHPVRQGDVATCGHSATGSSNVFSG
jgi:uncharacterized Zn-binding protein involved in type VI secretion